MAVYTHNEVVGSPAQDWLSVLNLGIATAQIPSLPVTEFVFTNTDSSRTHAIGTLTFSLPFNFGGTVTSLTRTDTGSTVYESLDGFSVDVPTLLASADPLGLILAGDDTFNGWSGADNLSGFGGDDTMNGAGGADTLNGGIGKDTLSGGDGSDHLIGGADDDTLVGGANDDSLDGGTGIDLVTYQSASAGVTISLAKITAQNTIGDGIDTLTGVENLTGSAFADKLTGNTSANKISGLAGIDTITGGLGKDVLTGGAQRDIFDFNTKFESGKTATTRDVITDFMHNLDDIDLRTIDANSTRAGDQAFKFIGQAAFHSAGVAEVRFQYVGANKTVVSADINGNGTIDFQIELLGHKTVTAADFLL